MKSNLMNEIESYFNHQYTYIHNQDESHPEILVMKEYIPQINKNIKKMGGRLITMIGTDERGLTGDFGLYYVFAVDKSHSFITVRSSVTEQDPKFPSITNDLPAANWYEREIYELLGLEPVGHPDLSPLVLHGDWPKGLYPLRKDYATNLKAPRIKNNELFMSYEGEGVTQIPVGPIHAGIIEPGHFRFQAVGDTILHLDAKLFYTHKGLEKTSEGMSINKALFLAERICGVCSLSHAISYAQTIEKIGNISVPLRAQYLRTLFLEMERLYNHIGDVGNVCAGVGFSFGVSQGSRLKELLMQLNERITGHRYLRGITDIGGVRIDINQQDITEIETTLLDIEQDFKEMVKIMMSHEIVLNRMTSTGALSKEQVDMLEVVGPAARASGRKVDIRKSHPYLIYNQLHFEVPILHSGDVLARIQLRIEEAYQTFSMLHQILENLPSGKICGDIGEIPAYKSAIGWTESPRGENIHWVMTGPDNTIYRYRVRSAPYSNWPAVPLAVKGNIVPDFPLINKSFELCYACSDR